MPTFIDESGDVGWISKLGSSRFFRMAGVWIPKEEAATIREAIQLLYLELRVSSKEEFKFTRFPKHREAFLEGVRRFNFQFAVVSIDKSKSNWIDADRSEIYWACATSLSADLYPIYMNAESELLKSAPTSALNELVLIDKNDDKEFLKVFRKRFCELKSPFRPGKPFVDKVKFRESHSDVLLQLADMIVGSVGAAEDGESKWFEIIQDHCIKVMHLP